MGNKSKQRTGKRAGLSWDQIRKRFPEAFMHGAPYRVAPASDKFVTGTLWDSSKLGPRVGSFPKPE